MITINAFSRTMRVVRRVLMALGCLFILTFSAMAQSGAGISNAIPIAVSSCGAVNFYDYRNSSSGYFDSFGHISPEVWYTFSNTSTINIGVTTCGSDFDTYLYILDQNQNVVYANDDGGPLCSGLQSSVSGSINPGTYYVVVEGYSSATGNVNLSFNANGGGGGGTGSSLSNPIIAGTFSGSGTFSDTKNNGDACFTNSIGHNSSEIYYRFTLTSGATVALSHCGSSFDTYMHLLDASGSVIATNDDSYLTGPCPGAQSYIETNLSPGTYYVVSEGYGSATGNITTNINVIGGTTTQQGITYASPTTLTVGTLATITPTISGGSIASSAVVSTLVNGNYGLYNPLSTATDAAGNIYVADAGNHVVRKITPGGVVSILAGAGYAGYSDGQGTAAVFQHPSALAVDASGNVYVSDQQNHRIRKISPSGYVSTFAGSGSNSFGNGAGTGASFSSPIGLTLDASGNLYVADYGNNRIRKITQAGVVSTFAGTGSAGMSNGAASSATFRNPMGLSFDNSGNLYVADRVNHAVRMISTSGTVSTLAGNGSAGSSNGTGTSATFNYTNGVAVDGSGNVYVADYLNNMIRKITPGGVVTTLAGSTTAGSADGAGTAATFTSPYGLSIDGQGTLYVAESSANRIRKISPGGFTISPALPNGLTINSVTGVISGNPTATSPLRSYTVTVASSSGNLTTNLSIEVSAISLCLTPSQDKNYVITYIPLQEMNSQSAVIAASCNKDVVQTGIQYLDDLGRPSQSVQVQGSPDGKDIIIPIGYDNYGREPISYQPYATLSNLGAFRSNAIQAQATYYQAQTSGSSISATDYAYSVSKIEKSPLARIEEVGTPGASWQPFPNNNLGHTMKTVYLTNTEQGGERAVRRYLSSYRWTYDGYYLYAHDLHEKGYYNRNELLVTITKDENWVPADQQAGTIEEYTTSTGQIILRRTFNRKPDGSLEILSTYSVYDPYGELTFILPPGTNPDAGNITDASLDNFGYQYRYDRQGRLIEKKLPGKGWEFNVYNQNNQIVYTQDANQRLKNQWSWIKYDGLGRIIITGFENNNTMSRLTLQNNYINTMTGPLWEERTSSRADGYTVRTHPMAGEENGNIIYNTVNFYDDYDFPGNTLGQPVISEVGYPNTKGFLTGSKLKVLETVNNLLSLNFYNLKGELRRSKSQNYVGGTDETTNTYSFVGQIKTSLRNHISNSSNLSIYNSYDYDHMGRKIRTNENINSQGEIILSEITYNDLGQMSQKRLHSANGSPFIQYIDYKYNERGWLKSLNDPNNIDGQHVFGLQNEYANSSNTYNGNIASTTWRTLTPAGLGLTQQIQSYVYNYDKLNRLTKASYNSIGKENWFNEELTYDLIGNIQSLKRTNGASGMFNDLIYNYQENSQLGNRLMGITDNGSAAMNSQYSYDIDGNQKSNSKAGVSNIDYNYLNLPETITSNGQTISFVYDASGNKLKKSFSGTSTDYVSGIQYENGTLSFIQTEEGRLLPGSMYTYEYFLKDQLGSIRAIVKQDGSIAHIQDYYSFGLELNSGNQFTSSPSTKYNFNGKEKLNENGINQIDYGARLYDPTIGRWNVPDPLAEKYYGQSPYNYAVNNPIMFVDPDGMDILPVEGGYTFTKGDAISAFNLYSGKAKNVYLSISKDTKEFNKPGSGVKVRNGQWSVFSANNFYLGIDALNMIGKVSDFSLENLVIETHGGVSKRTGEGIIGMTWDSDKSTNSADFITNSNLELANGEVANSNILSNPTIAKKTDALKALSDKVTDGGRLIFASCTNGAGTAGEVLGQSLSKFTGGRLNIFLARQKVDPRYYRDPVTNQLAVWFSRMFTEKFLQTTPTGKQSTVHLTISAKVGTPPITVRK